MRRFWIVTFAGLTALAAGCSSSGHRVEAGGSSTDPVSGTFATTTPTGSDATSVPSPPTPPPTVDGALDCGTFDLAVGWPTTFVPPQHLASCIESAFAAGTPARLALSEQTDGEGGSPLVTTYDVIGPSLVRVTVDATLAADRPQQVTVSQCRSLELAGPGTVRVDQCEAVAP